MEDNKLYSVTGIFDTPNQIIKAAKAVSDAGYKNYDVHTPYPVHGMDKAMKLAWSPLGYVALVIGLGGAFTALFFMWWTMSVNYPMIIGGKPFFALPAFIPVTFEVTVLSASVGTVIAMITFLFKFPNNGHPLHDTNYMKKVSADKFGISIEAKDKLFDSEKIKSLFNSLESSFVEDVYYDNEEVNHKHTLLDKKFLIGLATIMIIVSAGTYFALNKLLNYQPFIWMNNQHKLTAMKPTTFFTDGFSMREPVEGTVARGSMPYLYSDSADLAGEKLVNPLEFNEENLNKGRKNFNTFCSPCHNYNGDGVARLNGQFPNPPSLHSDKVRNWSDGRIFHVITMGQNTMPTYRRQVNALERWQIIMYVRSLQRAMNAKEEDMK